MKRHATTILLCIVAFGLGLWLWNDRDKVTEGERSKRDKDVFSAWRREDVSRIEIAHEDETLVLQREVTSDSAWKMTSPREERVDQAAVERLTTTLEFATRVRKVQGDAALGLDSPRARGAVSMGALKFRFALGGASPRPEGSSYFRVDDDAPFVVSKELTDILLARSDTYRDRTVVPYLSIEMARFEVKHPGGGFAVERSDGRSFKVSGLGVVASRTSLDKVWGALAEMRAESFPKDADAERLTAHPVLTIVMTAKDADKPPGELVVGDACPGHPNDVVVLRNKPTRVAACAPKGAIDTLVGIAPASLVDRRPFSFRHDEIEELRFEKIGTTGSSKGGSPVAIELARRGTGFHQREPQDRELTADEAEAVSEMLVRIEHDTAGDVRAGGDPFEAAYRARVRSGEYEEIVEVSPFDARSAPTSTDGGTGKVVIRRLRDDARLDVSATVARRLVPRETTTRARTLLGETRRVTRVVLRCGTPQEFFDEGTGLRLIEPMGYDTDGSIVQLVDALVRGKVDAWVSDADDGSFGLTQDGCRVVLSFADGNAPVTVRFGAKGEGGIYGVVDGRPDVFVAPLSLEQLAQRIYVSHASLRVEPSKIESVRVISKGKEVKTLDEGALREAVGGLFADRVVTLASSDVGPADLSIVIAPRGGSPKKVTCGRMVDSFFRCAVSGVKAVFDVHRSNVEPFFVLPDAGAAVDASRARD